MIHFEFTFIYVKKYGLTLIVCMKVAQSCPTLCDPSEYTVHGSLQAWILEWVAFPFSRGSSQLRDWTQVSHIAGGFFTSWATREAQEYWSGFSSVQLSCSVMSDSLQPHESQHTRHPCPSPTLRVYPNSYPSSRWCHPAILSSVIPFSSCPQPLPASESFPVSQLLAWGGQSIGVSALTSVFSGLTSFRMDWLDLLAVQGTLKSLLQHHSSKASIL